MNLALVCYGVLMMAGGYFGYVKAGSKVSLIMGIVSGVVILLGLFLTRSNVSLGYGIVIGMTAVLVVSFAVRLMKTHAFMPSGMLLLLSIAALAACIMILLKR